VTTETYTVRILVCDDHPVVRAGVMEMLQSQEDLSVVGEASDGAQAVLQARRIQPDVALVDLMMPGSDGFFAIAGISKVSPATQVLVLSMQARYADVVRAVEQGAAGYLLKDIPREDLFAAVRSVARGETPLAPLIAGDLLERLRRGTDNDLSTREVEVLQLAAKGMPNKRIAQELFISQATVKSHFVRINDKLGVTDRTAAVVKAIRLGYLTAGR
jgi:DNA-binding NarL/FixJ family response regulator